VFVVDDCGRNKKADNWRTLRRNCFLLVIKVGGEIEVWEDPREMYE